MANAGANTNFSTASGTPFIHDLVLKSDSDALSSALSHNTDITVLDSNQKGLMNKAIISGELSKIDQLVNKGINLKLLDTDQNTFLHQVQITHDSPSLTDYFLKKAVPLGAVNITGKNALDLALENSHFESAKLLIKQQAKITSGTFQRLYSDNNAEAVELLIQVGQIDPNTVLPTGDTLLIDAIKLNKTTITKALLGQNADPNLIGTDGEPPVSYATAMQNIDLLKVLIANGANVDFNFQSPAVERFEELIDTEGAIKWFIKRDSGITPVMMACDQGNLAMVKLLMENGARNAGSNKYRFWPGNFAARREINDIVQYMVGAEPGHRDRYAVVDLSEQRTRIYDKDKKEVMSFRISSGKSGHRTKTGEFVVTNKKRHHVSTLYNAPMPYFQRLSYGDFGFHTGVVPGYPASHGCIRCPNSYAYKLFSYLKVGDIVTIQK